MPYILVHPLPPPKRNPYQPNLPTFTTSSRAIAHFFHSHGWRAAHLYAAQPTSLSFAAPSLTTSRSSSSCSSDTFDEPISTGTPTLSLDPEPEDQCCRTTPTSTHSCGPVLELHSYNIPLNAALFHGPRATPLQLRYLRWYAYPDISFEDEEGVVDLRRPNWEAVERQREVDEDFWCAERRERRRMARARELCGAGFEGEGRFARQVRGAGMESGVRRLEGLVMRGGLGVVEQEDDGGECTQLGSAEQDDDIDEKTGEQWEAYERATLTSEGLEWAEDGTTLRKTRSG